MFSRSGKSTSSQYLVFREDNRWTQSVEEDDQLDSISENAFDESDFEIKVVSKPGGGDEESTNGFENKKRIGLRTIPTEGD